MTITTAEDLVQRAVDLELLNSRDLADVWTQLGGRGASLEDLRKVLMSRDLLTFYQFEHLIAEDRQTFHYGHYKVLYLVGTGTFARVYRATHRHNGQQVAVKVLRKRFCESKEETRRFQREGKMGMALKHPNIVPIYEVGSEGQAHYIVIEFIEGRNLRDFIKVRKIFEPPEATRLLIDVCNGLDYAFQQGVYHRDMKMSNVLISSRGDAKLVDFGLAGVDTKTANDDLLMKNPNPRAIDYAGLERATGVSKNDPRSDIFFVGGIYYHMLTGKSPIAQTKDRTQRLSRGRYKDIPPITQVNPSLPREYAVVVNKALNFDPDRRYQTPGEMAADLKSLLERDSFDAVEETIEAPAAVAETPSEIRKQLGEGVDVEGEPLKVMVIEADVQMQDVYRNLLKRYGYRVLVVGDPQRAVDRFTDQGRLVDLILVNSKELGESAIELFNKLGEEVNTKSIGAILLLEASHRRWQDRVKVAGHRVIANMPIKARQLRELMVRVIAISQNDADQN